MTRTKIAQLLLAIPALLLPSCSGEPAGIPGEPTSEAWFDYFDYAGSDDYYAQHPLSGPSDFYNPVIAGFYSDPSICKNDKGDFYLVTSTFTYFPGVPIFHSRDLVNWKLEGHVLDRESQLVNMEGQHVSGGIFAPAITFNPRTSTYYMITTNVGAGNFYVKTQDPTGDWSDPIYVPSVLGIDPSIFIDDNGKAYVVNNDDAPDNNPEYDGHRTVRIQELDLATDQMVGERKIIVNKGVHPEDKPVWCEAPHIYKIKGWYYLMTAEGGTGPWHSEVIYRSKSVWGPYEAYKGNPILTQRTLDASRMDPITCAGHADLVQTDEGDWWGVFLACRPVEQGYENLGRETFMLPVKWTTDGWPYMLEDGESVSRVLTRFGVTRQKEVTFGNFSYRDEFLSQENEEPKLDLNWLTLRKPATDLYSLDSHEGWLTLKEGKSTVEEKKTPAMVCRRPHHHKYECSTRMRYVPGDEGDAAGLVLFKDEQHSYFFAVGMQNGERTISVRKTTPNGIETLAKSTFSDGEVTLKIKSTGTRFSFIYMKADEEPKVLVENIPADYLSTAVAGGFTGTMLGLYAVDGKK